MTILLGGSASPMGWSVQYVDATFDGVLAELIEWRRGLSQQLEVSQPQPFPQVLDQFEPFQAPWTWELLLPCGSWTAYLNDDVDGGDLTASASVIADLLGVRWVGAEHTLRYGPGHQSTQLWVCGPAGEPPLMSERTIAAYAEDGRWSWNESGAAFPFEDVPRYQARRKRDRSTATAARLPRNSWHTCRGRHRLRTRRHRPAARPMAPGAPSTDSDTGRSPR